MKILFFLLFTLNTHAQLFSKNNIAAYALITISGAASGVADAQVAFRPFIGDHNWDSYISWTNKYKNNDPAQGEKFPLSTSVLVGFTDGWHAMNMTRDLTASAAVAISLEDFKDIKHKWVYILEKALLSYTFNRVGHIITYDLILKNK